MEMTIEIPAEVESRLTAEAKRIGVDPAGFVQDLLKNRLRQPSQAPAVSHREAELLQAIDIGFSQARMDRFGELIGKRRDETITGEELNELLETTGELERLNVKRVRALSQLAELRGVDLETVMDQLGIEPPDVL